MLVEEELNHLSISTIRHCVIVKSQERCEIFSPKELPKEQDDVAESPKTKRFSFR